MPLSIYVQRARKSGSEIEKFFEKKYDGAGMARGEAQTPAIEVGMRARRQERKAPAASRMARVPAPVSVALVNVLHGSCEVVSHHTRGDAESFCYFGVGKTIQLTQ